MLPQTRAARASLLAALAVLAIGLGVLAGTLWYTGSRESIVQPAALGGPFTMVDQDGRTVDQSVLTGRTTLMFFGFRHCPDVCPTKLFEMTQIMERLGPAADRVQVLLVSVDPERDTPALLKDYVGTFDPRFRALTGTPEQLATMARLWRVYYRKVPTGGESYTMDHTAAVYVIDAQGRFVSTLDTTDPDRAAATLRQRA